MNCSHDDSKSAVLRPVTVFCTAPISLLERHLSGACLTMVTVRGGFRGLKWTHIGQGVQEGVESRPGQQEAGGECRGESGRSVTVRGP